MKMIKKMVSIVLSIPNTIRFNFHYFNFSKAITFPVLVSYKVQILSMGSRGDIICPNKTGCIQIGFSNGSFIMGAGKYSCFDQKIGTKLEFMGSASFANPIYLVVNNNGVLHFGSNFQSNTNTIISCAKSISFGDDNIVAWNTTIIDGDGHSITKVTSNERYNNPKSIVIGNHVWIASNATVLKGSYVGDNSIISSNAMVNSKFTQNNVIIGGVPAKIIKHGINWDKKWL